MPRKLKVIYEPRFDRHPQSGIIRVRIHTPRGGQWLSTGQTSHRKAKEVCHAAKIAELQMAACAGALSHEVVSRLLTGRAFSCADIFELWKQEALLDLRPDTYNGYETTLRHWMEFCDSAKSPLSAIKRCHLDHFVNQPHVSAGTRKGRLNSLRSFYKFAAASGYCVGNPAERVRVKTFDLLFEGLEGGHAAPFAEEEFRLLMASPKVTPFWRCATALGWYLGLRKKDCACLELASITGDSIIIHTKKTGARIEIPLDDPHGGGDELRAILAEIRMQTPPGSKFCFPEKREQAIAPKRHASLSRAFGDILIRHGIKGKSFHSLRHAFATRMKRAGLSIAEIAKRLGHSTTTMTELYVNHDH